jgi:hypothetical protein
MVTEGPGPVNLGWTGLGGEIGGHNTDFLEGALPPQEPRERVQGGQEAALQKIGFVSPDFPSGIMMV